MLERMQSERNTTPLLVEVKTCIAILEIIKAVSQKIENQSVSRDSDRYQIEGILNHTTRTIAHLCFQQHYS